jgi:hypothetical protein
MIAVGMKKIILISCLLFGIIISCIAQIDRKKSIATIKTTNNIYIKTIYEKSSVLTYENAKDTLRGMKDFYKDVDKKARIKLAENKTINNILIKFLSKSEMERLPSFQGLVLSFIFNSKGKVENITFNLPSEFNVSAIQLEEIEKSLKRNLAVTVLNMDSNKKFIDWTLIVRFSQILEGTYPY